MSLKSLFKKLSSKKQKTETTPAAPADAAPTSVPAPEKYFVRFSNANDLAAIHDFYDLNAHKSVRKRQDELVEQLVNDGAIVLIEDAAGNLVASSITYAHRLNDANGIERTKWQEIGTTRIVLNGYPGLFDAMVTMQVLRTFLVEPPEDKFVAQMHTDPVQKMAGRLGWRRFDPCDELKNLKKNTVSNGDQQNAAPDINWFFCGVEALPIMARHMVKALENPVLENKKTGARIELDFSKSSFFTMFADEIKFLATQDRGDVEHPDMKRGVADSRNRWLKKFFR